jgi:hypothetical protein
MDSEQRFQALSAMFRDAKEERKSENKGLKETK